MVRLESAGVVAKVDAKKGWVDRLWIGRGKLELPGPGPAGFVEVVDLHDGRTFDPLGASSSVRLVGAPSSVRPLMRASAARGGARGKSVAFSQRYDGAAFAMTQALCESDEGVRWDLTLKLRPGERANHSLRVTWVLPMPGGWKFWAPQNTTPHTNDGATPHRYLYGHVPFRPHGTLIPLVGIWGEKAALAAWSPPDIQKPCMSFDLETLARPESVRGITSGFGDVPHLRVTYHHVGLRPGRELRLAVCLAAAKPDWRSVLRRYVEAYPELFEPVPATRATEGMYGISNPIDLAAGKLKKMVEAGVTFLEVHGHFPEYSVFVDPETFTDPKHRWICRPHPMKPLSLEGNRRCIRNLQRAGIAAFMYFYNCHAMPDTIKKRWPGSTMRDEAGRPLLKWYTEPSVWGPDDSPFGKHILSQMDLLIEAYPEMDGVFFDNYAIEMYDFGHDDGVTMVHDKPVYDLNRNHQLLGPPCFEKVHAARKIVMVNKISTVESLRGADMVLSETGAREAIQKNAMACVFRPLFPLGLKTPPGERGTEWGLKWLVLHGAFPDAQFHDHGPKATAAYRPLTDAMIGKRLVLDPDPLDVPEPLAGEVYRIDKAAPQAGSAVVVLVDFDRSWQDRKFRRDVTVTVRLPEAARYTKATWLTVEKSAKPPILVRMRRKGTALTVRLPELGAAGILRLSRG